MGDVGSQFLGFAFAGIGVLLARRTGDGVGAWIVPLLLFHFLFDTAFTAGRRARRGARLWEAHREHLYQRLNRAGLGHGSVTLWLSAMASVNGGAALVAVALLANFTWLASAPALLLQMAHLQAVRRYERKP
jgi:UDP-GlcNAc:undecaprenyl-phosphate/decaprenyl-phosphate GlcNAc-1-phosphate transferase